MIRSVILAALALTVCLAAPADDKVEPKKNEAAEKVKKLQTERRDLLKKLVDARYAEFQAGRGTLDLMLQAAKDLLSAELDLATKPEQRLKVHEARLDLAKKVEQIEKGRYDAGRTTFADYTMAQV